eukprot:GHUV01053113.1.p1 GENE.GHUV01053113.1~~GHUV01053113.1.p1  ORF type:complete len:677 (+),score=186.62 GHUV01053113.1:167-2197(+)
MRSMEVADRANSKQLEQKGSWKELFKGFSGLSSNVKGTKGQLQRLLTTQLTDYNAWSPPEDAPEGTSPVQPRTPSPPGDATSRTEAPGGAALEAAAHEALQTAAEDLDTFEADASVSQRNSGDTDTDISVFVAYGTSRGPSFTSGASNLQLSRLPTPNLPPGQYRTASNQSSAMSGRISAIPSRRSNHISPTLSRRYSGMHKTAGTRLQPSATLQRMETSNAWWELKELQEQQSQKTDDGDDPDGDIIFEHQDSIMPEMPQPPKAAPDAAPSGSKSSSDGSFGAGLLKALGGITSGGFTTGITSRLGSMFNMLPGSTAPIYSKHLKKTPHTTLSTDGWTLHLLHITDTGLSADQRRNYPILMCPGLASSGTGTFDVLPKESIADFLAADGYEVWVIDLRGNGKADKQSRVDLEIEWNIDDYLVQDVPACIEYVLKQSKADMLHWMGHSMGGMLGSGLCSQAGKWGRKLRSVMLCGSGCFGDGSWHVLLKKLVAPIVAFGFPAHYSCQALALLSNTPAALSVFETLFYWCPNMDKGARKALLNTCFNFIPQRLLGQFLASHGSAGGLSSWNGDFLYADPDVLAKCKVPCLGLNGDYDLFCPAAGGAKNVDLFGGPKKHLIFGPAHGHQYHYGHFDVIVGKNAQLEVWPSIKEWLAEHDAPAMTADDLWGVLDDVAEV